MRTIIHSDMNSFYASVEQAEQPCLRGLPVIVGGDEQSRHGIVLAASYEAKAFGISTAMTLKEARSICPQARVVPPRYQLYHRYSQRARAIYYDYTDQVEPFGPDEAWLDVTSSKGLFGGSHQLIAQEISERIKSELGLRVSIGISWNKIFAKFGSDYQKPEGYTCITPGNMKEVVWKAPVRSLLYVGPATERKLLRVGIKTIGQLACADPYALRKLLGKNGLVLQEFALGHDCSPVKSLRADVMEAPREVKSIGNGTTLPFDGETVQVVRQTVWILGESVAQRLRAHHLEAKAVTVSLRDARTLRSTSCQRTFERPTSLTPEICQTACELALSGRDFRIRPVRAISVKAHGLSAPASWVQLDLEGTQLQRTRMEDLDKAIDQLRRRYGNHIVRRGAEVFDSRIEKLDPERDHTIHPVSFFG